MRAGIVLPILAVALLAACGTTGDTPASKAASPGALVTKRPLEQLDPALSAAAGSATYIRYESTSPAGDPIEVSGAVFVPPGEAPAGGWPVVAFAHGTSGVVSACAPTNSPTLFGSAPVVEQLLAGQRAVVMTNYQGLDGPGRAPYLDTPSSGYDVLDSVRAAHATGLPLAADAVLVGASQGGRAAESAAETAKAYAPELKIRGAVLLSPALSVRFVDTADGHRLNAPEQYLVMPYLVAAVRYDHPGYAYDQVLHGDLLAAAPGLESRCTGQVTPQELAVGMAGNPDEVRFVDQAAAQPFADLQARTNLPKSATTLPVYIARGDIDKLVETAWSNAAVNDMCTLGTPVHDLVVPGGHDAPAAVSEQWLGWIADLFAGKSFQSTCPY
ncbi:alpha/beta hydrolase [Nocardia seriolae]|uniref:lipase family protein n=1 Tax=Nocardia seriolae TaxID=37332 RepID=UPI0013264BB4|nr:lipase family protein [Nocardia seriolae]MTJ63320.1 alpha/beta hydrolase [Nocardia seriolae]MTJ71196.1 alpha/beta hydrolase [Nocardia seriolae]MTK49449.1 alpha/beta hydrolase [Nocardia seriolae]MTL14425.1 alpha/beta hydrolase [Nocardia seriolae]